MCFESVALGVIRDGCVSCETEYVGLVIVARSYEQYVMVCRTWRIDAIHNICVKTKGDRRYLSKQLECLPRSLVIDIYHDI